MTGSLCKRGSTQQEDYRLTGMAEVSREEAQGAGCSKDWAATGAPGQPAD